MISLWVSKRILDTHKVVWSFWAKAWKLKWHENYTRSVNHWKVVRTGRVIVTTEWDGGWSSLQCCFTNAKQLGCLVFCFCRLNVYGFLYFTVFYQRKRRLKGSTGWNRVLWGLTTTCYIQFPARNSTLQYTALAGPIVLGKFSPKGKATWQQMGWKNAHKQGQTSSAGLICYCEDSPSKDNQIGMFSCST